jgi:hypothetical protein
MTTRVGWLYAIDLTRYCLACRWDDGAVREGQGLKWNDTRFVVKPISREYARANNLTCDECDRPLETDQ